MKFITILSLALMSTAALAAPSNTAKLVCTGKVGPNSIGEMTAYLGQKDAVIEKLTFQYNYRNETVTVSNERLPEGSLESWPTYSYELPRGEAAGPSGYYYEINIDKDLIARRFSGPLPKGLFEILVSNDQIHVWGLAGQCSLSWQ